MSHVTQRPCRPVWIAAATNEVLDAKIDNNKIVDGYLVGVGFANVNAADAWLQLFNKAAEDVDLGVTDKPYDAILLPAGDGTLRGGGRIKLPDPVWFRNSIAFAVTTTPEGNTAPASTIELTLYVRG